MGAGVSIVALETRIDEEDGQVSSVYAFVYIVVSYLGWVRC